MPDYPTPDFLHSEPKWQAIIPDSRKWFFFNDGTRVNSLWELRLALATVSDQVLGEMMGQGFNHIATWVRDVVGDTCLSNLLAKAENRWDMIVDLERHMIRTLALPSYLAIRWLEQANHPFVPVGGVPISTLREFTRQINNQDSETYKHLLSRPGDVIAWLDDSVGDYLLADLLQVAASTDALGILVLDHVAMLEYAEKLKICREDASGDCESCGSRCDC